MVTVNKAAKVLARRFGVEPEEIIEAAERIAEDLRKEEAS